MPQPIDYFPDLNALIMEHIEGRPLVELGDADSKVLAEAVRLVACLHESEAEPRKWRDTRRIVRALGEKVRHSIETDPRYATVLEPVIEALEAARVDEAELVPCHGDFSPRNVLVGSGRVVLIDWDRLQWADPARDLAYAAAWCWVWALRRKVPAEWSVLQQVVDEYARCRSIVLTERGLSFHVAAGLLRIAHAMVTLWPADAPLVPRLAAEALGRLRQLS
jgi:aminoglycoside phosphotransferase (APT) family kinase protein